MSEHEPMNRGGAPSHAGEDPREERLRALYTRAYEPVSPSQSLRARVGVITTGADTRAPRRTVIWQLQPARWPAMGGRGRGCPGGRDELPPRPAARRPNTGT